MTNVQNRQMVVPGQLLGEGLRCDETCCQRDGKAYSMLKGLTRIDGKSVSVIAMAGPYIPKAGDVVVGVVEQDLGGVYFVNIDSPYTCVLRTPKNSPRPRDNRGGRGDRRAPPEKFQVGDVLSAKIAYVDEVKEAQLVGPRKLEEGLVVHVKPKRVPRIIGKKKSMLNLIRDYTGVKMSVGQNGLIWLKGGNIDLALDVIAQVQEKAHISGLTDAMAQYMKSKSKN